MPTPFRSISMNFRSARTLLVFTIVAVTLFTALPVHAAIDAFIVISTKDNEKTVVATTDSTGHFTGKIAAPGKYMLHITCKTEPCPRFTATVNANGAVLKANPDMSYTLTVETGKPVSLTGLIALLLPAVQKAR